MNLFWQTLKQLREKAHLHIPCLDHQTDSLEEHSRILILRHSPKFSCCYYYQCYDVIVPENLIGHLAQAGKPARNLILMECMMPCGRV